MRKNYEHWQVSLSYCKSEVLVTFGGLICAWSFFAIVMTISVFFISNQYQLPINFFIVLLPVDGNSVNWSCNYFFQVVDLAFAGAFICAYVPIALAFMNHCCWGIDITILLVKKLDETLDDDNGPKELQRAEIAKRLKKIVDSTYSVLEWQGDVQGLLRFNFMTEFSLLSFIFCMCLYTMTSNHFSSIYILCSMITVLSQLFIYCFMGNRINLRVEKLTAALYDTKWYEMEPKSGKIFR